ncbi:hypothetical protein MTO96_025713 [Rhipicephalus appendiculatus]
MNVLSVCSVVLPSFFDFVTQACFTSPNLTAGSTHKLLDAGADFSVLVCLHGSSGVRSPVRARVFVLVSCGGRVRWSPSDDDAYVVGPSRIDWMIPPA